MTKIIALGDSITYGGGDLRGGWVQRMREFLDKNSLSSDANEEPYYTVYNLGISGDTTDDLIERAERELKVRIDEEESIIIFAIGINDTQFLEKENEHHVSLDKTITNIRNLINIAKKYSSKVIFFGLTPVDEKKVTPIPWNLNKFYRNQYIEQYNQAIKNICAENNLPFVDMLPVFQNLDYKKLLLDGLHPNTEGYEEMYKIILSFLINNNIISAKKFSI